MTGIHLLGQVDPFFVKKEDLLFLVVYIAKILFHSVESSFKIHRDYVKSAVINEKP